LVVGEEIL
jgi:hypothetical protein